MHRTLRRHLSCAGIAATLIAPLALPSSGQAAVMDIGLQVSVDCDPAPWSLGSSIVPGVPSRSDQCSNPGIGAAQSTATYTTLKTAVKSEATSGSGIGLLAGASFYDSITVAPTDGSLLGTPGVLRIRTHLDGTLSPGARIYVGGAVYLDMDSYIEQRQVAVTNSNPMSAIGVMWTTAGAGGLNVDESITFYVPIVFGTATAYGIGMSVQVNGPNQSAGFLHTAAITSVEAWTGDPWFIGDPSAVRVPASFSNASGIDIVAEAALNAAAIAAVPEPATPLLLLAGLGLLASWARHRQGRGLIPAPVSPASTRSAPARSLR